MAVLPGKCLLSDKDKLGLTESGALYPELELLLRLREGARNFQTIGKAGYGLELYRTTSTARFSISWTSMAKLFKLY